MKKCWFAIVFCIHWKKHEHWALPIRGIRGCWRKDSPEHVEILREQRQDSTFLNDLNQQTTHICCIRVCMCIYIYSTVLKLGPLVISGKHCLGLNTPGLNTPRAVAWCCRAREVWGSWIAPPARTPCLGNPWNSRMDQVGSPLEGSWDTTGITIIWW